MKLSTAPLPSVEHELACDETLLEACEQGHGPEVLRFWEPRQACVVLGYANRAATEANLPFCEANGIRVLRRCSGGGTVLQTSGCLNYSLVLRVPASGPLATITSTNRWIMERHRDALARLVGCPVLVEGFTDLAIEGRKFSGNAQRRKGRALLFHGCFLLQANLPLIEATLRMPSKEPGYRQGRPHRDFLINLEVNAQDVVHSLVDLWQAAEELPALPLTEVERLVDEKYRRAEWNLKF
jgi:lipoate-protein ligase A